ncbi:MAG: pimeloyl-[acyl-carrier protein] methyl ester esterase [Petroclostridium sp.]|jgi:pimeloyl-[acyl-carrier protein] methyl ester esterase|nr:pimeloyl-[acyl-carrier protein] methyl ester esterase [Petroclostridium sp.]
MEKPHLIMLPGWGMASCVWMPIQEELAKNFQILFVEWDGVHSIDGFKEKVLQLITTKQILSFSLLGWSLGSLVALDIASEYQAQIRDVILIGGTSRFTNHKSDGYHAGWPRYIVERMKCQLQKDKEQTLLTFYDSMFSSIEKKRGDNGRFLQLINKNFCNSETLSLLTGLDYLIQTDFREKLKFIKTPLLLIHGEKDQICPVTASELIASKASSDVTLKVLPDVGHLPFFTNPDQCMVCIKQFIKDGSLYD